MSRFLRTTAAAVLAAAAFGALATAAQAQTYNRLVVFGDSLSDNGNLYALSRGTQPASPPYFQGRFSNGPVFTELLGFNAGRFAAGASASGSVNYAFGGAIAGRETRAGFPPGLRDQLDAHLARGGTFGAGDLVSVLGGANNLLGPLSQCSVGAAACVANPTGFVTAPALQAATDINLIVSQIATRGAGTIVVSNLPRLGLTPRARAGGANGIALGDYAGSTFNTALLTGLNATAATQASTNIILVDLAKISDTLAANPSAFGLSNVTDACFNETTLAVCANPDSYLYWDSVHPTAAGHRLLAQLADDYLYYGDRGAQSTVQGETAYRQREDMLDAAAGRLASRTGAAAGTHMTFSALYDSVETDARGPVAAADTTGWGFSVGLEHGAGPWSFGFAGTLRDSQVDAGPMDFDVMSYGFDAYAGWRSGNLFLNAVAGGSIDQYDDITRVTALAPVIHTGETDGGSRGFKLQGGMWFDMGGIALSPRAALNWVSTEVDGYVEQGAAAQYEYADRTLDGFTGEVALRAEGGGDGMNFFVEGGYRDSLSDTADPVRVGIAGNPAKVLQRSFDDPFGGSMMASAGASADFGFGELSLSYRGRFGDSADAHTGMLTYRIALP